MSLVVLLLAKDLHQGGGSDLGSAGGKRDLRLLKGYASEKDLADALFVLVKRESVAEGKGLPRKGGLALEAYDLFAKECLAVLLHGNRR